MNHRPPPRRFWTAKRDYVFRLLVGLAALIWGVRAWAADVTGAILDPSALTEQPVATRREPPDYPFVLRRAGTTGTALVEFVITASGAVTQAWVVRATQPEFGAAALQAVKRWQFEPGKVDGQPVNTRMRQPLSFSLSQDNAGAPSPLMMDRERFVSLLPPKLYVDPTPSSGSTEDFSRITKALEILGPTKTSFVKLPTGAKGSKVHSRIQPNYPRDLRESGRQGAASFLVWVDERGEVKAIHALVATDPAFAESGGVALAQWKFAPAEIRGTAVPVVFERTLRFELR